ncbi:S26 family signal peptidase, partial [Paenibacillus rubinfantis]|uniref:S26 family signal peptidase n=1 Tax=Paenibacillus rubinfantis TaxID=1720296 RepID=UPI00073E96FE
FRLNTTDSAPTGVWRIAPVDPAQIARGSLVSVCPPPLGIVVAMRERGYLHPGDCPDTNTTPLLKPVVAVAGDTVTVAPGAPLIVNGKAVPDSAPEAGMPAWTPGTYTVQPGELWVISSYSAGSFDSRYFGPVAVKNLRGRAAPVLVRGDVDSMTKGVAENASF